MDDSGNIPTYHAAVARVVPSQSTVSANRTSHVRFACWRVIMKAVRSTCYIHLSKDKKQKLPGVSQDTTHTIITHLLLMPALNPHYVMGYGFTAAADR